MVQTEPSTTEMRNNNLPQALILLNEMKMSADHVASLVDNMIVKVKKGDLGTDQGLSFLEMKYNILLSYLINLTYVVLKKCTGETISGHPCIDRLVEIRTVLEKIKPIDQKLKYQIDKLVKIGVTGSGINNPTNFKATYNFETTAIPGNDTSSSEGEESNGLQEKKNVYVPPKIAAVHYIDDERAKDKTKLANHSKKKALSEAIMQDLREEYLETPLEVSESSRAQQFINKQHKEREAYEEEYMTRLPVSKSEKHSRRKISTIGSLGDEVTNFGALQQSSKRRKYTTKKNFSKKRKMH